MADNWEPPGGLPAQDALLTFGNQALVRKIEASPSATKHLSQLMFNDIPIRDPFALWQYRRSQHSPTRNDGTSVIGSGQSNGVPHEESEIAPDQLIWDFNQRWQRGELVAFGELAGGPLGGPARRGRIDSDLAAHLKIVDWQESIAEGRGRRIYDLRFHLAKDLDRWQRGLLFLEAVALIDRSSWEEFQAFPDRRNNHDIDYAWFRDQILRPSVVQRDVLLARWDNLTGWQPVPDRQIEMDVWWRCINMESSTVSLPSREPVQVRVFGRSAGIASESQTASAAEPTAEEIGVRKGVAANRPGLKVLVAKQFDALPEETKNRLVAVRRKKTGEVGQAAKQIYDELKRQGYDFEFSSVQRNLRNQLTSHEVRHADKKSG